MLLLLSMAAWGGTTAVDLAIEGEHTLLAAQCARLEPLLPFLTGEPQGRLEPPLVAFEGALDPAAPGTLVVRSKDGASVLAFDVGTTDPAGARAAAEGLDGVAVDGIRVKGTVPVSLTGRGRPFDVAQEVTAAWPGTGCTVGFDVKGVGDVGVLPKLPVPVDFQVAVVSFGDTPGEGFDLTLVTGAVLPVITDLLAASEVPLPTPTASTHFPIVVQSAGTARDVAGLLGVVLPGTTGELLTALSGAAEKRVRPGHGPLFAMGPGMPALMVVPMDKPRGRGGLAKLARLGGKAAGWDVEKLPGKRTRLRPPGMPAIEVGVAKGLLVASPDATTVDAVLAGEGEPLLPPPQGPYGVRALLEADVMAGLPQGYFEASYAGDRLTVRVRRPPGAAGR